MQGAGIALRRQLQGAEPQHLAAAALVAHPAIDDAGDRVRAPSCEGIGVALAPFRRQPRLSAVRGPLVRGIEPLTVAQALQVARFDALAVEGELLPQACADRKDPGVRVRRVDRATGWK